MKKIGLLLAVICIAVLMTGCSNVMNKTVNMKDFPSVEKKIMNDNSIPAEEKDFIIKNLSEVVNYSELAKALKVEIPAENTFAKIISDIRAEYANGTTEETVEEAVLVEEPIVVEEEIAIDTAVVVE